MTGDLLVDAMHREHWEPWVREHPGHCMAITGDVRPQRNRPRRMCRNRVRFLVGWMPVCGVHLAGYRRGWPKEKVVEVRVIVDVRVEPVEA